jgi:REP element-mobilizing transposase RayT
MQPGVWSLRTRRCFTVLKRAMYQGASRFGFRLVHYAVMGNHIHLLVEAVDRRALARGMQGLGVRIARGLNALMQRSGRVVSDRYHAHILRTPTEARHARTYLLQNARRHYGVVGADSYTSTMAVAEPETFLMRRLC